MNRVIDLRSDTVSKPTDAMRRAMAEAEVGDDVFGDDPTVNRLEAMAAERMAKEAAVYVPSGTMANLISVMTHTQPGDEAIMGNECHIYNYEVAGSARVAHIQAHILPNQADGSLDPEAVRAAIREPGLRTSALLCLENTHNRCGSAAVPSRWTSRRHRPRSGLPSTSTARASSMPPPPSACPARIARDRLRLVLPFERAWLPGWLAHLRRQGVHPAGAAQPQDPWRRHAPGRDHRRRRHLRAR
jgi:hypothetical protein